MSTLSPRQMFLLDNSCAPMREQKGVIGVYLVGTAMGPRDGHPPRDIDVRMIVGDKAFDLLERAIGRDGISFMGIAYGQYLASITGLPVDFQVQRMTESNAQHKGPRNPLGRRSMASYQGDIQ